MTSNGSSASNMSLINRAAYRPSTFPNVTVSNDGPFNNGTDRGPDSNGAPMIVAFVFLGVLSVLITVTNSSVIYFVAKKRYLKTTTNISLASLASSDLLAGVLAIPLIIACNINPDVCLAMDITSRFISYSTVLHLLAVTLERYVMIVHAMKYRIWITKRRVRIVLGSIWVFSAFTSLVQLAWIDPHNNGMPTPETLRRDLIYGFVCFFGIVMTSLILMVFSLCRIFLVLRRQLRNIKRLNSSVERSCRTREKRIQRKAATIFATMIIAFMICWFSYFLDGIRQDLNLESFNIPFWAAIVLVLLRFTTSLVNPLLYTFIKEDFKRAMNLPFLRFEQDVPTQTSSSRTRDTAAARTCL